MEQLSLRFDGGEASNGRLHFYEYTRSQYATARFITTIEHFRRTGKVTQRITSSSYVEILVETPKEGSFVEVILVKAQETAAVAVTAPLSSLIAAVWNMILPRSERTESDLVEMAKIQQAQEIERTKQSEQETERMRIPKDVVESQNATTQQGLKLVNDALQSTSIAYGRAELDQRRLLEIQGELESEETRRREVESAETALASLDDAQLNKLTSRLRSIVPDMALPLKKSAETLEIEAGPERRSLLKVDKQAVAEIVDKELDDDLSELQVRVRSYDRD